MRVSDVAQLLGAELLNWDCDIEVEVTSACGSDLMSDVMAYGDEKDLLLTGLVNPQVIRTAEMMDIKVIVFVRGKSPSESMLELASEKGIILMTTPHPMFVACGRLSGAGVCGGSV